MCHLLFHARRVEHADTTVHSAPNPFGAAAGGSSLGGSGSIAASQAQQQSGLFASASSQPSQPGSLFAASNSQPAQSGGLFGSIASQPAGRGLFGSAATQPASSGLFGAAMSQAPSGGLFGNTASQQSSSGGLFGSASQPTQGGGLFGTTSSQPAPSGGLFGASSSQPSKPGGLFGAMPSQPAQPLQGLFNPAQAPQPSTFLGGYGQSGTAKPAATLNLGQQSGLAASTSMTRIDLDHLRPTTKFDHLTEELQREIINLDTAVLNEINRCHEVSNLLPAIAATGSNIPNDVVYVTQKIEEVEVGLENDAADIQYLKEQTVQKDAGEARLCFREVDRLKMPTQYQTSVTGPTASVSSGVYGGHGLSGWWNHPQTLQRSVRGGPGAGSRSLQLPGDEDENNELAGGPSNLIEFFDRRTEEMKKALAENKSLLVEIEEFVMGVEGKIAAKQLEVMGGNGRPNGIQGEEDQIGLLQYVFGEFERSLYEVADKVGGARDGVQELVMGQAGDIGRAYQRATR